MNYLLFNISASVLFVLFLYRILNGHISKDEARNKLIDHLVNKGNPQIEILKLNTSEKLKYGVPVIWLLGQVYRLESFLLRLEYVDSFKIEYQALDGKEWTKYVEVTFKNKEIISYSEFDSFEI